MLSVLLPLLLAQAAPIAECDRPAGLPAGLAGWRRSGSAPAIGRAFTVKARDPAAVRGLAAINSARPGGAALVPVEIATAGTYRIALSEAAWIDVVRDGVALRSVAHGHGPRCSGIRKIVDFKLTPGRYALQLSGMKMPAVRVLIVRA